METAKIFTNGGSQAVRLPKQCRFEDNEVLVNHIGNVVILLPKDDPWNAMLAGLEMFTEDFLAEPVEKLDLQERDEL